MWAFTERGDFAVSAVPPPPNTNDLVRCRGMLMGVVWVFLQADTEDILRRVTKSETKFELVLKLYTVEVRRRPDDFTKMNWRR